MDRTGENRLVRLTTALVCTDKLYTTYDSA